MNTSSAVRYVEFGTAVLAVSAIFLAYGWWGLLSLAGLMGLYAYAIKIDAEARTNSEIARLWSNIESDERIEP